MFFLLTLLTLIWQTLSYWSLWPPLPSPAAGGLFPCDPVADSGLFFLCKMHLSYFQLLFPHVTRLQPGEKSTFSEPWKVLSHLQTLVHLKEAQFLFLRPLVWFVSAGVNASITHGCIPKHSDQNWWARNIWCSRLRQNNKCRETLGFSERNIKRSEIVWNPQCFWKHRKPKPESWLSSSNLLDKLDLRSPHTRGRLRNHQIH